MKFKIVKKEFINTLSYAINFTSSKELNTIYQNIYIEALDENIIIKTFNGQSAFQSMVNASVEQTGKTTVPCKKLLDIVKELPDNAVINITLNDGRINLKCGRSSFNLSVLPPETFPTISEISSEYFLKLPSEKFEKILKKTQFCISNDPSKIEYTGCHLKVYGNIIEASAADYQRIAYAFTELDEEFSNEFIINIPKKTVTEVFKLLDKDETVEIYTDRKQIHFKIGSINIYSKLLEKYIRSIKSLFSAEYSRNLSIKKELFIDALKRVSAITNESNHGIIVSLTGNRASVYSIENDYGAGQEYIEDIDFSGEPVDIFFNSKHLIEVLSAIDSEYVKLKINARNSPVVFESEEDWYKYIIVPLSIERF